MIGPVKLRDADLEEVLAATRLLADRARILPHKLDWIEARSGPWVLASVPISMLSYQEMEDSSAERIARALAYARLPEEDMPPGLADYGPRSRLRRTRKAYVFDGNHRVLGLSLAHRATARMWMPRDGFLALQADAVSA